MRLLMYYDGTDSTRNALEVVKQLAKALNAKVHVLSSFSGCTHLDIKVIDEMENNLDYIKGILEDENILCETHLLTRGRHPGEDIIDIANKYRIDEIIIGTNRTSGIERFTPDCYINHVLGMSRCPVLIV